MAVLLNRSPLSGQWGLELGQGGSKRERNVYRTDGGTGMMRTRWKGGRSGITNGFAFASRQIGDFSLLFLIYRGVIVARRGRVMRSVLFRLR